MPEETVVPTSTPEPVVETVREDVITPTPPTPETKLEEKVVPYSRFKEVNDELATLKKNPPTASTKSLEIDDFINISASLEGMDQREKEYLAEQHKLTGRPLNEIKQDENFQLWQTAYKQKVEKERALKPSSTQTVSDKPMSLGDKLKGATLEEQEILLSEAGLYSSPRPKADRVTIGAPRVN